jgi:hypothetical protein
MQNNIVVTAQLVRSTPRLPKKSLSIPVELLPVVSWYIVHLVLARNHLAGDSPAMRFSLSGSETTAHLIRTKSGAAAFTGLGGRGGQIDDNDSLTTIPSSLPRERQMASETVYLCYGRRRRRRAGHIKE